MAKGAIVLITFPFTDLSGNKLRPAVILGETNRPLKKPPFRMAFLI